MTMASLFRLTGRRAVALAAAAFLAGLAVPARAQSPTAPPTGDKWEFVIAPYLMGAALDGTSVVRGREAEVDISAGDIFDHLDLGFMGMLAARKGNWGISTDFVFMDLDVESQLPPADLSPSLTIFQVNGVRKLSAAADVTFGVRGTRTQARIDFKAPINVQVEKSRTWASPVAGVVLRTPGEHRVHATLLADIGGFGLGSDLTWQIFPTVGVKLGKHVSLEAGYRWMSDDYETGEGTDHFEWNILYQGPVGGIAFRF
jgi:hypothetical protein